jgi:hypothetical protein
MKRMVKLYYKKGLSRWTQSNKLFDKIYMKDSSGNRIFLHTVADITIPDQKNLSIRVSKNGNYWNKLSGHLEYCDLQKDFPNLICTETESEIELDDEQFQQVLKNCLRREIYEEIGVDVSAMNYADCNRYILDQNQKEAYNFNVPLDIPWKQVENIFKTKLKKERKTAEVRKINLVQT